MSLAHSSHPNEGAIFFSRLVFDVNTLGPPPTSLARDTGPSRILARGPHSISREVSISTPPYSHEHLHPDEFPQLPLQAVELRHALV